MENVSETADSQSGFLGVDSTYAALLQYSATRRIKIIFLSRCDFLWGDRSHFLAKIRSAESDVIPGAHFINYNYLKSAVGR